MEINALAVWNLNEEGGEEEDITSRNLLLSPCVHFLFSSAIDNQCIAVLDSYASH